MNPPLKRDASKSEGECYCLDYDTPVDPHLQKQLEVVDLSLRSEYGIPASRTAVGLLDLKKFRLAMVDPDRVEYAASLAKIGILLAYFHLHPGAAAHLQPEIKHELGLMIKASSNEAATRFSRGLGLARIQGVLNSYRFYDPTQGGGIWVGKHYGDNSERIGDPVGDNSHAATVRQLLRFYMLLEQGKLVSPEASAAMRDIFASPEIPHDPIKFVKGLAGRAVAIRRKWGSWEDWLHDSAVIEGPNRYYILVALTRQARGDEYLEQLAQRVDELIVNCQ